MNYVLKMMFFIMDSTDSFREQELKRNKGATHLVTKAPQTISTLNACISLKDCGGSWQFFPQHIHVSVVGDLHFGTSGYAFWSSLSELFLNLLNDFFSAYSFHIVFSPASGTLWPSEIIVANDKYKKLSYRKNIFQCMFKYFSCFVTVVCIV